MLFQPNISTIYNLNNTYGDEDGIRKNKQGLFIGIQINTFLVSKIYVTPLAPFDPISDPTSIRQRWKTWKRQDVFNSFEYKR